VDPRVLGADLGLSEDDHPHADIRNGQAFLNRIYRAVTASPAWPRTVLVFNYDEWGGFFEHVPPPAAPVSPGDVTVGNTDGLRGFRVPAIVVSPFARREEVSHVLFDHTSILRMIEWRWALPSLTVRDQTANNLAEALQFTAPSLRTRQFNVPAGPFGTVCLPPALLTKWDRLLEVARFFGFPVVS
jgi:phospholipase C